MSQNEITVYTTLRTESRECEFGEKHKISIIAAKRIRPTGRNVTESNGYFSYASKEYVDAQGRFYYRKETVDFFDNISYVCEGKFFKTSRPRNSILVSEV